METNCAIHWIEIYPVDSAIRRLNNRGQKKRYVKNNAEINWNTEYISEAYK